MRSSAHVEVLAGELGEFGHAQAGAQRDQQQGVVPATGPGAPVGDGKERVAFGVGQPGDDRGAGAARLDGQHPLDDSCVVRCPQGGVAEQRADRGQPGVAGPRAVAAAGLEPAQERSDQIGVELADVQPPRRGTGRLLGEAQEQAEGVAIGADRMLAGVLLGDHPVGEEALQNRGEIAHWCASLS